MFIVYFSLNIVSVAKQSQKQWTLRSSSFSQAFTLADWLATGSTHRIKTNQSRVSLGEVLFLGLVNCGGHGRFYSDMLLPSFSCLSLPLLQPGLPGQAENSGKCSSETEREAEVT